MSPSTGRRGGSPRVPAPAQTLEEADRAERMGDVATAVLALRAHLERAPDDATARLRFARLLAKTGELAAARRALAPLDQLSLLDPVGREAWRRLAELDEADGALVAAAGRWERLLADDLDDPHARTHLALLRPEPPRPAADRGQTLVSPAGVETTRYRLIGEAGRGATATVYYAEDTELGIEVALKVLHPQLAGAGQSQALRRFFAEARVAAAVRHPRVIAIYDVDEGARALVMEWVAGGTLRDRLRSRPDGLDADELDALGHALREALSFLHLRGIVHGDLKPSNLLLRLPRSGRRGAPGRAAAPSLTAPPDAATADASGGARLDIVLADFGAAQLATDVSAPDPYPVAGTPLYLAPEQFDGAPPSPATDLYAAGAILWEAALGRPLRKRADLLRQGSGRSGQLAAPQREDERAQLAARAPRWADVISALLLPSPSTRQFLAPPTGRS